MLTAGTADHVIVGTLVDPVPIRSLGDAGLRERLAGR